MRLGISALVRSSIAASFLVLGAVAPTVARAQSGAADELYKAGIALIDKKDYPAACEKFQASYTMEPLWSTLTTLAACREKEGKVATALGLYQQVARNEKQNVERQRYAEGRAKALDSQVIRFTIDMRERPKGLTVALDGKEVAEAVLGVPLPMDPGEHSVLVTAPNKRAWNGTVLVAPDKATRLDIAPLEDAPQGTVAVAGADGVPRYIEREKLVVKEVGDPGATQRTLGYVSLLVGGGCVIAGGVGTYLAPIDRSKTPTAKTANTVIGVAGFAAGGLLVVGGTVLLLTAPSRPKTAAYILPSAAPGFAGVVAGGSF